MRRKEGDKANEILNAAIRVFAKDGFDKAQVSAIAANAGVGTGSIYLYFSGKENILNCLFARFWENLASDMESLRQSDPLFRMNDQLGLFFDRLVEDRNLARIYLREHHRFLESNTTEGLKWHRKCLQFGEAAFQEIVASKGTNDPRTSSDILRLSQAFLFGGVRSALEAWLASGLEPAMVRRHMQTMAMASILAATGRIES